MKKTKLIILPIIAAVMLAGCSKTPEANRAPTLVGVSDIQCLVNGRVDFLDGVAALDREDGDITNDVEITVKPDVEVTDGYAVFTKPGDYEVTYRVEDSEGAVAEKTASVEVIERELHRSFAEPEGFSTEASGTAEIEKSGMVNGVYTVKATGGEIAEDLKLTRTYTLNTNVQYTFKYKVNSKVAGKIKVTADGEDCAEIFVKEGESVLTFAHTARSKEEDTKNIKIDLCLGNLEGDIEWELLHVENEYPVENGKIIGLTEDFKYTDENVLPRFERNKDDKVDAVKIEGKVGVFNEGKSASLEITTACDEIWRGGMFINTGVAVEPYCKYVVAFDVQREKEETFEVVIQRGQWAGDGDRFTTLYTPLGVDGRVTAEIEVKDEISGKLWLYIQAGTAENKITISNLEVQEKYGETKRNIFPLEDFTQAYNGDFGGELKTDCGKIEYFAYKFSGNEEDQAIVSPAFYADGSGANYVITFRAKASKRIQVVFAAPVYGGWDEVLVREEITFTEEEQFFTFYGSQKAANSIHTLLWRFGSGANVDYTDVVIEISDIKVSNIHGVLDV